MPDSDTFSAKRWTEILQIKSLNRTQGSQIIDFFFQMKNIDKMAIGRMQQMHQLKSSKPKDRIFQDGFEIVPKQISVTYQS